ncbi:DinB family protein [Nocardia neocaledoniensis]|uniref:DinB family protein n=1 Tax=Nocardia neocaledoniensis TaxID=236511 RepID=A0A317N8L0_9NOCA|nr:DinB family protein [Nocardia neocaledoniensis]
MSIDWNAEIRGQIDLHWTRQLRPRFEGLTDAEFFWEPVPGMWTVRPVADGFASDFAVPPPEPAPVTTIAWRLGHVTFLLEAGLQRFGHPPVDFATYRYAGTAADALRQLDDAYRSWIEGVGGLGDEGLAEPAGPPDSMLSEWSTAGIVLHTHRELLHHGAEIALLRDLYRAGFSG